MKVLLFSIAVSIPPHEFCRELVVILNIEIPKLKRNVLAEYRNRAWFINNCRCYE